MFECCRALTVKRCSAERGEVGRRSAGGRLRTARVARSPAARPADAARALRGARAPPRSIPPAPTTVAPAGAHTHTRTRSHAPPSHAHTSRFSSALIFLSSPQSPLSRANPNFDKVYVHNLVRKFCKWSNIQKLPFFGLRML